MENLVLRAKNFAIKVHKRIDHRRKYTQQPYAVHLEATASLVTTVTDDQATIAAAWLHDTVEDTPATIQDIEAEFGQEVANLVAELTDVSKSGDGNRATRKEIDRQHIARSSARAKTVKLADLISNSIDICEHDPRFGKIFLKEMKALLKVLHEGDSTLLEMAHKSMEECSKQIEASVDTDSEWQESDAADTFLGQSQLHVTRLFTDAFTAKDISEPLLSFDADASSDELKNTILANDLEVLGIREAGRVKAYVRSQDLTEATGGAKAYAFSPGQVINGDASMADVIQVLTRHAYCFISLLGEVVGIVVRGDMNKPVVRMWLFGIVTITEMDVTRHITQKYPNDEWIDLISPARVEKARTLLQERRRLNHTGQLLDCLQIADKAEILIKRPEDLQSLGFGSKRSARQVAKELQSLRNNLSHAQDIVTHDWAQIARIARRVEEMVRRA